jgi:hypothetical protein
MENHLKEFVTKSPMTYASGTKIKISRSIRAETLGLIRYADDFVILLWGGLTAGITDP